LSRSKANPKPREPGKLQRLRARLNGNLPKLVPILGAAAVTGAATIYIFAPNQQLGQLVMAGELCLSLGLALGYLAGKQQPGEM